MNIYNLYQNYIVNKQGSSDIRPYLVPADFIASESSQETALQYIDTGVSAPDGFMANLICASIIQPTQNCILWAEDEQDLQTGLYNSQGLRMLSKSPTLQLGQSSIKTPARISLDRVLNITFSTIKTNGYIDVNGTVTRPKGSAEAFIFTSNNLYLFACNSNGIAKDFMIDFTILRVKIWDINENLIRDFVPVYNKKIQKFGLFDYITQAFFGNLGQGDFIGEITN